MITLPWPPSANNLFFNVGNRRVVSEAYKAWRKEAGITLAVQRPKPVQGRYRLSLVLTAPDRRARDADNYFKAVSDLLKTHGVIEDDSFAKSVFAEWSDTPPAKPGSVRVSVVSA